MPSQDPAEKSKRFLKYRAMGFPQSVTYDPQGNMHTVINGEDFGGPAGVHAVQRGPEADIASQIHNVMARDPSLTWHEADTQVRSAAANTVEAKQSSAASEATTAGARSVLTGVEAANAPAMAAVRLQKMRQEVLNEQTSRQGGLLSNELKQRTLNGQLTEVEAYRVLSPLWQRPGMTSDVFNEYLDSVTAGGRVGSGAPAAPAASAPPAGGPPTPAAATGAPGPAVATPPPTQGEGAPPPRPAAARPGRLPAGQSLYKPNAQEQSTLDTIAAAGPMMQRVRSLIAGHEQENSWGNTFHAVGQDIETMVGHNPSDPVYQQLDPLIQHLKVFSNSPYLHGIRNGAFVKQVQDNTPSLTDTPARITAKLNNLEQNFRDIAANVGAAPGGGGGAAQPPPGGGRRTQAKATVGMRDPAGNHLDVPPDHVAYVKSLGGTLEQPQQAQQAQ